MDTMPAWEFFMWIDHLTKPARLRKEKEQMANTAKIKDMFARASGNAAP